MEGSQQSGNGESENSPETSPEGVAEAQAGSGTSSDPTPSSAQSGQAQEAGVDPQTGGQTEFRHNRLQGRSPAEIERYVQQLEDTVREQGTALTAAQRQQQQQPQGQQRQQQQEGPPQISEDEFFSNPGESVKKILEYELNRTVKPLNEEIQTLAQRDQAERLRSRYRSRFPDWDHYEGQIELMAQRAGMTLEQVLTSEQVTQVMYYAAKGMTSEEGTQPMSQQPQNQQGNQGAQRSPGSPAQQQPPQGQQQQAPQQGVPQHRPSAAPLPNQGQGQQSGPTRELTENERRLAREYGMTAQQFLEWQSMEADAVVSGQTPGGD